MGEKYLPHLTDVEKMALSEFLREMQKNKKTFTEVEIDEFMEKQYSRHGRFESCVSRVTKDDLIIKRPIGWSE